MLKKLLVFLLTLLLPCFLFLELWASYRYTRMEKEIRGLENEQIEWVEANKELLAEIAEYNSPERVYALATEQLGLESKDNKDMSKVVIGRGESEN